MYRVTIAYGQPTDTAAFDEYYTGTHLPIAGKIPGVQRFAGGKCESLDGNPPAAYLLAEIFFADKDEAAAGFGSEEGQAAAADIANFATGGATIYFSNEDITIP
ncbi:MULTISPECIES: EthD family reductase [Rhodococcus]|uniref:EthD family reductase n=1 Tax=Rhodococcus erythropolis TaxID=1833 RepID=A0A8I1D7C0_RHOER|nr:EthD family reductase [Rhodococcus erythropolis]MBH5143459.1 EthD family reductase [Rhodococcus erythropolis]